jgi:glycogen debranching enzyme
MLMPNNIPALEWCDKKIAEMDEMIRDFPEHSRRLAHLQAGFVKTKQRFIQLTSKGISSLIKGA